MHDVQVLGNIVVKENTPQIISLSAKQILDLLVNIGDKSTELFDINMLCNQDFVYYQTSSEEGSYRRLIETSRKQVGKETGIIIPEKFELPFGRMNVYKNKKNKIFHKKQDLEKTLENLIIIDDELFERTSEKELASVEYYVSFPWSSMNGYFHNMWLPEWFEELGVPKTIIPTLSKLYSLKERLSGKKEFNEVTSDIYGLMKKMNPNNLSVLDWAMREGDIFSYKNRIFYFTRTNESQKKLYNTEHMLIFPELYWMFALYNSELSKPIGYSMIRSEKSKLMIEDKQNLL